MITYFIGTFYLFVSNVSGPYVSRGENFDKVEMEMSEVLGGNLEKAIEEVNDANLAAIENGSSIGSHSNV
jgi:hypothetical protein